MVAFLWKDSKKMVKNLASTIAHTSELPDNMTMTKDEIKDYFKKHEKSKFDFGHIEQQIKALSRKTRKELRDIFKTKVIADEEYLLTHLNLNNKLLSDSGAFYPEERSKSRTKQRLLAVNCMLRAEGLLMKKWLALMLKYSNILTCLNL